MYIDRMMNILIYGIEGLVFLIMVIFFIEQITGKINNPIIQGIYDLFFGINDTYEED